MKSPTPLNLHFSFNARVLVCRLAPFLARRRIADPNITFPVLSLRTVMESYEQPKVDVLRMSVSTLSEWKTLKNLINTGVLAEIRQLVLNIDFKDADMWKEYW